MCSQLLSFFLQSVHKNKESCICNQIFFKLLFYLLKETVVLDTLPGIILVRETAN